jgi:hypothetical protein
VTAANAADCKKNFLRASGSMQIVMRCLSICGAIHFSNQITASRASVRAVERALENISRRMRDR